MKLKTLAAGFVLAGLTACAGVDTNASLPVNVTITEAIPEEAAIGYLQKVVADEWRGTFQNYATCEVTDAGFIRVKAARGTRKELGTFGFENAEYSIWDNAYNGTYQFNLFEKNKSNFGGCLFLPIQDATPENLELFSKVATAMESLGIERVNR